MKQKNKVHIIHGIHQSEGGTSTPALVIPNLEDKGYDIKVHNYGYVYALTTRWRNPERAAVISRQICPGDIIIAHSNGCDITRLMLNAGIAPRGVIFLQPALDVDTIFPEGNYWINVFYNEQDKAVFLAKWFLWFHHPYGAMGRYGYQGNDLRVKNYDTLRLFGMGGHSSAYQKSAGLRAKVVHSIKERESE